ncbi:hypothetical protein ACLMAL_16490 [Nocardia sp. CWNU-33]|uniref:hypothetical protein n=1 Tax=Nocardia sp. CWNU-33 TaxID=3392117 RepID=UPI00398EA6CB
MGRYRSSSELPLPADWDRKAFGAYRYAVVPFVMALVPLPMVLAGMWAIVTNRESVWPGLVPPLLMFLVWVAPFAGWGWSVCPREAPTAADIRSTDTGNALVLPVQLPSRIATFATGAVGVLLLGVGLWQLIASFNHDLSTGIAAFFLLALPGMVALLLFAGTYRRRVNTDNTGIQLTARHITINYGDDPTTVAWHDISAIGARCYREGTSRFASRINATTLVTGDADTGYRTIDIAHKALRTDPTRVYHQLMFYLRNPGLRSELGTEPGLDRFRRGGYLPEHSLSLVDRHIREASAE